MRSTFNILFYVNKSKGKNGVVPVMGRVTINGTHQKIKETSAEDAVWKLRKAIANSPK